MIKKPLKKLVGGQVLNTEANLLILKLILHTPESLTITMCICTLLHTDLSGHGRNEDNSSSFPGDHYREEGLRWEHTA